MARYTFFRINLELYLAISFPGYEHKMAKSVNKYSVLLPTYNERQNLPIIVYLLFKHLSSRYTGTNATYHLNDMCVCVASTLMTLRL